MARERRIGDGARQQADAPLRDRHVAVARRHLLHLREARIECQPATAHALRHRCVSIQAQTSCHQVERRPICAPLHCLENEPSGCARRRHDHRVWEASRCKRNYSVSYKPQRRRASPMGSNTDLRRILGAESAVACATDSSKHSPFPTISSSGPQERQCSRALREPAAGCTESPALGEDEVPRVVSQQCALPGAGTPSVRHPVVLCPQTVHQELCAGPLARTRAQAAAARRPVCLSR